jgi:AP-1-like transcription factor
MDSYNTPLWDLSQATNFAQLPDDDFLAMLQKQFPTANNMNSMTGQFGGMNGINPQNVGNFPPGITPPSEDSSPSPDAQKDDGEDSGNLKRKANDGDDSDDGPSHKNHHTGNALSRTIPRTSF